MNRKIKLQTVIINTNKKRPILNNICSEQAFTCTLHFSFSRENFSNI